jgi:hypothetical protein
LCSISSSCTFSCSFFLRNGLFDFCTAPSPSLLDLMIDNAADAAHADATASASASASSDSSSSSSSSSNDSITSPPSYFAALAAAHASAPAPALSDTPNPHAGTAASAVRSQDDDEASVAATRAATTAAALQMVRASLDRPGGREAFALWAADEHARQQMQTQTRETTMGMRACARDLLMHCS